MKKIIIAISVLLSCILDIHCQDSCRISDIVYENAYNYIKKAMPEKCLVCVSNHIIDLGFYVVSELDSFPDLKKELQDLDDKKSVEKGYSDFYSKTLDKLFAKPVKAKAIIYFSKMQGSILRVDLVICSRYIKRSIDFDSAISLGMGNTFSYIFFFRKDGTIRKAFCYEMLYEAIGPVLQ